MKKYKERTKEEQLKVQERFNYYESNLENIQQKFGCNNLSYYEGISLSYEAKEILRRYRISAKKLIGIVILEPNWFKDILYFE